MTMKVRISLIVLGGLLWAAAVMTRLSLAYAGTYRDGPLTMFLRGASLAAMIVGLILPFLAVLWPFRQER